MKVKELIELLKQQNPELNVMIDFTDHTDWRYTIDLAADDVETGEPSFEGMDSWDEVQSFDDEGNYIGEQVVLLKLNL
jgi:hypothetical protein